MKAAVVGEKGVEVRDLPKPEPKPNEVLIRVRASSLNRADLIVASGHQHGSVGGVGARIGLECSGEVEAVGGEVKGFKAGDRVMGSAPGGFAEYVVTDAGRVHRIPGNNMTYEQAACFPVALQTMHNAVVTAGRLKRGETLLMQGASSGVGLMGMQIGKLMGASLVIGTSTNAQRRARLEEYGCDLALDSSDPDWPEEVKKATGGKGVDLIVDLVSGGVANRNLEAAAILGRIVNVGRLGGMKGEFDFDKHALKRIDYIGVTFRTRTPEEVREINRLMRADLWPAVEAGKLSLPIYKTYPLADVADALAVMRANQHFGKIVITSLELGGQSRRSRLLGQDFVEQAVVEQQPSLRRNAGDVPVAVVPADILMRIELARIELLRGTVVDAADVEHQRAVGRGKIVSRSCRRTGCLVDHMEERPAQREHRMLAALELQFVVSGAADGLRRCFPRATATAARWPARSCCAARWRRGSSASAGPGGGRRRDARRR